MFLLGSEDFDAEAEGSSDHIELAIIHMDVDGLRVIKFNNVSFGDRKSVV